MHPRSLPRASPAGPLFRRLALTPLLVLLLTGPAVLPSCREERAAENAATQVLVPRSRTARERQATAQAQFAELTGNAPARVVWVEDPSEESSDTFAESDALHLMGWDTRDGGPRRLAAEPGNFGRPLLTPDGSQVIFTEKRLQRRDGTRHLRPRIRVLQWDTGKVRTLGKGFAVDTWAEPGTGRIWVYAMDKVHTSRLPGINGSTMIRFPLDDPDRRETVWTRTRLSVDSVQISRDGRRFSALFPWPDAGIGDFASGRWNKLDVGCWPALAPDDSYVAWVFDGPHRNLRMVAPENDRRWAVNLSGGPDLRGREAYHPRWSNHPQFVAFTGPYTKKKKGTRNAIASGGLTAEVHLGRFSDDWQRLETTVRLTNNKHGDFYPDFWVDGATTATLAGFPQKPSAADPSPATWPPSPEGLVFVWRDLRAANEVPGTGDRPPCHLEARSIGRFTPQLGALLDGGWFEADPDSNAALATALRAGSGLTIQALLTEWPGPADAARRPLLAWQTAAGEPFLSLEREGEEFHLTAGQGEHKRTASIRHRAVGGQPVALALVWQESTLRLTLNGTDAGDPLAVPATLLSQCPEGRLILGQPAPVPPAATGRTRASLERLTVHARPLAPTDVAARAEADLAAARDRPTVPRVRVRARVLEATEPDLDSLDTYHRMLVDHTYEVTAVIDGVLEAKKIAVLHWGVLDDRLVPGFPRAVGAEVELELEAHAAHPELQGELTDLTSEEFGLPLFLDVATPAVPAAP
jgi:hypothetical protein